MLLKISITFQDHINKWFCFDQFPQNDASSILCSCIPFFFCKLERQYCTNSGQGGLGWANAKAEQKAEERRGEQSYVGVGAHLTRLDIFK